MPHQWKGTLHADGWLVAVPQRARLERPFLVLAILALVAVVIAPLTMPLPASAESSRQAAPRQQPPPPLVLPRAEVLVLADAPGSAATSGEGAAPSAVRSRIRVRVAADDAARTRGLMFRRQPLADDEGMLFLWPRPLPVAMWMKNTFIPLDMVFIDADGMVVRVHENARPHDLTPIPSGVPVRAVLEVAAGAAARLGLRPGVFVRLPAVDAR